MIIDPEIERWRKVRRDIDGQFKSIEEFAAHLIALDKKDKGIVFGSPAASTRSARRQVKRRVRSKARKSSSTVARKVSR